MNNKIVKFGIFYVKQLWHKAWFLIGFIPAVIELPSFWIGAGYLSNPVLQKIITYKWGILLGSIIAAHVLILFQQWKQYRKETSEEVVTQSTTSDGLPYRQAAIADTVEAILRNNNVASSFSDRYRNGLRHLNNESIPTAASEYYAAFLQIEEILLRRNTYNNGDPDADLLDALRNSLSELRQFSNEAQNDGEQLRRVITTLENTIGSLSSHINL